MYSQDIRIAPSYIVYISQLVCYACVCCDVFDSNEGNLWITGKLLSQGYRYHKLLQACWFCYFTFINGWTNQSDRYHSWKDWKSSLNNFISMYGGDKIRTLIKH